MSDASLIIRCDCHSPEHMMIFDVWHWDTEKPVHSELNFSYQLDPYQPLHKRVLLALRYVLTGKTQRCWWSDTVVNDADAGKLRDFLSEYLATNLNARGEA